MKSNLYFYQYSQEFNPYLSLNHEFTVSIDSYARFFVIRKQLPATAGVSRLSTEQAVPVLLAGLLAKFGSLSPTSLRRKFQNLGIKIAPSMLTACITKQVQSGFFVKSDGKLALEPSKNQVIWSGYERVRLSNLLLGRLKAEHVELCKMLKTVKEHWSYEDMVYRFYHQSLKVYWVQDHTIKMVKKFEDLLPERKLNPWFLTIVNDGTRAKFELTHNDNWLVHTRPLLEAFFHAKYFLEMMVQYSKELEEAPQMLPSGWASILYLYNLR